MGFLAWVLVLTFRSIWWALGRVAYICAFLASWYVARLVATWCWLRGYHPIPNLDDAGHAGLIAFVKTHTQVQVEERVR